MEVEQRCFQLFAVIGALTTAYLCVKFIYKLCHALRVYGFKSYPNFSNYGRWSGKL